MLKAGLDTDVSSILARLRNYRLIGAALLANLVLVPLYASGINRALSVPTDIAIGISLMAVAAGTPLIVMSAGRKKGGSAGAAIDIQFILAAVSVVVAPFILKLMLPNDSLHSLHPGEAIAKLVVVQLIPMVIGIAIASSAKQVAQVLSPVCGAIFIVSIVVLIVMLRKEIYSSILSVTGTHGLIAMFFITLLAMLTGFLLGGPMENERRTLTIATALRNPGLATTIASSYFGRAPLIVSAILAYLLVQVITTTVVAAILQRSSRKVAAPS